MKSYFSSLMRQSSIAFGPSRGNDSSDRDIGDSSPKIGLSGEAIDFHETKFIDGERGGGNAVRHEPQNVERQNTQNKAPSEARVRYKGGGAVTPYNGTDNRKIDSATRPSRKLEKGTEESIETGGEFKISKGGLQGNVSRLSGVGLQGEGVRPGEAPAPDEAPIVDKRDRSKVDENIGSIYGKELVFHNTLREVREWLTEIPQGIKADNPDEGGLEEIRVRIPGHQKDDNKAEGIADFEWVQSNSAQSTSKRDTNGIKEERSTQDIHLSIGSINLTVEEPRKENQHFDEPRRTAGKQKDSNNRYSSRLSRHYIHTG